MIKSFIVKNHLNERLELILTDPDQSGIIVESVTGLGPGKSTVNIKEIANSDGGSFNGARNSVRNIVMNLIFLGDPSIEDTRQKTYRYFPLKKPLTLTVVTDNHTLDIDGYVESNEPDIFSDQEGCQISILCPKFYFYTKTDQVTTSSGETPMFEFPVDNELIENPDINDRIPSDESFVEIVEDISSLPNDSIKENNFQFDYGNYTVVDSLNGNIPYIASYQTIGEDPGDLINVKANVFAMQFPWNIDLIETDIEAGIPYNLNFLVDAEILRPVFSNESWVKLYFSVEQDNSNIYKTDDYNSWIGMKEPTDSYDKSIKSKNLPFSIPITKDIITKIKDSLPIIFRAYIDVRYKNGSGSIINPNYNRIEDEDTFSFIIHNITLNKKTETKHPGYADEEILWYKWNDKDCSNREIIDNYVNKSLEFPVKINDTSYYSSRSLYMNPIYDIIGYVDKDGHRKLLIKFDLKCKILKPLTHDGVVQLVVGDSILRTTIASYENGKINDGFYKDLQVELTSDIYYKIFNDSSASKDFLQFSEEYISTSVSSLNPEELKIEITNIRFYEILQPSENPEIVKPKNYLVDKSMPNYTFEKNGITYNLQASNGIIMGEINKYHFEHYVEYKGSASIGFQMTIEFMNSLVSIDKNGKMSDDPGYIVIKSNYYPGKKMIIDLNKVKEILPEATLDFVAKPLANISNDNLKPVYPTEEINLVPPVAQKGDLIFIDTRKRKKSIRYQKPNGWEYEVDSRYVYWDHKDYKINILPATNRDIEWFEISQGKNVISIYHTYDPEKKILTEEELIKVHADRLSVEIRNQVYYEGV